MDIQAFLADVWSWGVLGLIGLIVLGVVLAIILTPAYLQARISRTEAKKPYPWQRRR